MRRVVAVFVGALALLVVVAAAAVIVLTNTDFGRERVRRFALHAINGKIVHGIASAGHLSGNLLRGLTADNVAITDSAGAPFVSARQVTVRYALRDLWHKRLYFRDVRVDHPVVVLHQSPDGTWNFKRIFPSHPNTTPDTTHGLGDWVAVRNARVTDGRVLVLRADTIDVNHVTTSAPYVRITDPTQPGQLATVSSLQAQVTVFRPPVAQVTDVVGTFHLDGDSLWTRDARLAMPGSRIAIATARYTLDGGDLAVNARAAPVALADARFAYPRLPSDGKVYADASIIFRGASRQFTAREIDLTSGSAHVTGMIGLHLGDAPALSDTKLRFAGVDTHLIEQVVPGIRIPRHGVLSGQASLAGSLHNAIVDGDVAFDDATDGRQSRLSANGAIGMDSSADGRVFHAHALAVTLDSVQVALLRVIRPTLPLYGVVTGQLHVDGATNTRITADADLVHADRATTSHIVATASAQIAGRPRRHPLVDLDATVQPLSLVTVGRFMPALGLQGQAIGHFKAEGDLGDVTVHGALQLTDGPPTDSTGGLTVDGHFDLATPAPNYGYDVTASAVLLDAHAVVTRAPRTTLTAMATASGRGIELATMRSTLSASMRASIIDSLRIDTAAVGLAVADGLARVDSAHLRLLSASIDANGSIGVAPGRTGTLIYTIAIDSLGAFRQFLPVDTTRLATDNHRLLAALARARGDTARSAVQPTTRQMVERAIANGGEPTLADSAAPAPPIDTAAFHRDVLLGKATLAGQITGSIDRFNLRGRIGATDVVAMGNSVRRMRAEYAWLGAPKTNNPLIVAAQLDTVSSGSFALDSIDARVVYHQPHGALVLLVRQRGIPSRPGGPPTHDQEYTANADFLLQLPEHALRLNSLALRFDTTLWSARDVGSVRWGPQGLTVHQLFLSDGGSGHIIVDGTLPATKTTPTELHVDIQHFQIGDLAALVESQTLARGDITLRADVSGTTRTPIIHATAAVHDASYHNRTIPDVSATADYDSTVLTARAELARAGEPPFAFVNGHIPIRLGLGLDSNTKRLPDDGAVEMNLRADSIPFDIIPEFVSAVRDMRGRGSANIQWRGTLKKPQVAGYIRLDNGAVTVLPLGIRLTGIASSIRVVGDSVRIDSLVAKSQGWIRATGTIDLTDPSVPVVSILQTARNARVINTQDRGRANVDDSITVDGPITAPYVTGRVHVLAGVIYIPNVGEKKPIDLDDPVVYLVADTGNRSTRTVIPAPNPLLQNLLMDVDVKIEPTVWVRNKDANVEIQTDGNLILRTNRETHSFVLDGQVETERGQYTFLSKRFEITKGSANFIGTTDFNPTVNATAQYGVTLPSGQPLNIQIQITGTAQAPVVALSSDAQPPLSQSDIISYLAFGQSSSGVLSQGTGAGSSGGASATAGGALPTDAANFLQTRLATLALGTVTQDLQGNVARSLNADVFNISTGDVPVSATSSAGGAEEFLQDVQFEFGKYVTPSTYIALRASAYNWNAAPPGGTIETRIGRRMTLQALYQPLYLLNQPSLDISTNNPVNPTKVFGLFLLRDWRF
jgi:autotransporter translocation and assembly factor TamB